MMTSRDLTLVWIIKKINPYSFVMFISQKEYTTVKLHNCGSKIVCSESTIYGTDMT